MTWGSACSNCGREDCSWVRGDDCEGRAAQHRSDRSEERDRATLERSKGQLKGE